MYAIRSYYAGNIFVKHKNIAAILIAAVLIAGAAGGGYLLRPVAKPGSAFTTVYSPAGQRTELTLPDNSKVLLNRNNFV